MRRRSHVIAIATLALFLTAFTLKQPEFEIEFPDGWDVGPKDDDGIITVKPAGATDGANCNVYFVNQPKITESQAALNDAYRMPISVADWNDFLATKTEDTRITDRVAVDVGGKVLQIATVDVIAKQAKARIGLIVTTGRVFDAGCYATADAFDSHKAVFEKIVRSLRAK